MRDYRRKRAIAVVASIAIILQIFCLNTFEVLAEETSEIKSNRVYNVINVKNGDSLDICDMEHTETGQMSENDLGTHMYKFVYEPDKDAYRIYIVCEVGDSEKVLDIVRLNGKIVSGCSVQTYNPVDDVSQLWRERTYMLLHTIQKVMNVNGVFL